MRVSLDGLTKNTMDCRRANPRIDSGGLITLCGVETQASFVQRIKASAMFTTKALSMAGASIQVPSRRRTCNPPGDASDRKIVMKP